MEFGKPTEKLSDLLRTEQDARSKIQRYFMHSPLFKAITEHVYKNPDTPVIEREADPVVCYSYGIAVSFQDAHLFGDDNSEYSLRFNVTYRDSSKDEEYQRSYYINVPIALEEKFTQRGFKQWLSERKKKRDAEREKADMELLPKLAKRYPEAFKKIARGL